MSSEISQIANAPGLDGDAYSFTDIWWNSCRSIGSHPPLANGLRSMRFGQTVQRLCTLGACPRIEGLLRKSHFGPFLRSFSLNMSNYSSQMTEKMDSKWLSLATTPILGQAPCCFHRYSTILAHAGVSLSDASVNFLDRIWPVTGKSVTQLAFCLFRLWKTCENHDFTKARARC